MQSTLKTTKRLMIIKNKFLISFLLLFFLAANLIAQPKLSYTLSMTKPYTHYFEVTTTVTGLEKDYIDFILPVWAPGSYLIRDFPKNVEFFKAFDKNGAELKFEKTNKYTWRVYSKKLNEINISYNVYAFEASVRTSFLDDSHGYLNGSNIFMYIYKMKDLPSTLKIIPHKGWKKVNTGLEKVEGAGFTYHSPNYDILADSPIEIGNQDVIEFKAAEVNYKIAMYGEGNYQSDTLKKYMKQVIEAETNVFGENPNKNYTFIVHNLTRGSGGLEHLNSTTLEVNRWTYQPESKLRRFLSLVAHEHFHLWNVKRIRPLQLGPFDYEKENYTKLLWEMEGVTSYYSNVILRRIGIYTPDNFLGNIAGTISGVENQPGNDVQSVADASFDAWIKAYQPDENSYNTTISYYSKGAVLGALLDLVILNATNGEKNYDNVLKYLYNEYYKELKRGFTEKEYQEAVEKIAGENLDQFFADYVNSAIQIDYNKFFNYAGLKLVDFGTDDVNFGARTTNSGGNVLVRSVKVGAPAYDGGINVHDEIISINGYRVDPDNFDRIFNLFKDGDNIKVLVSRDDKIKELDITLKKTHNFRYKLVEINNPTEKQQMIFKKWLAIK